MKASVRITALLPGVITLACKDPSDSEMNFDAEKLKMAWLPLQL